jgi:hypothetical protein
MSILELVLFILGGLLAGALLTAGASALLRAFVAVVWPLRKLRYRRPRFRVRSLVQYAEDGTGDVWRVWDVWSVDDPHRRSRYRYYSFRDAVNGANSLSRRSRRRWELTS